MRALAAGDDPPRVANLYGSAGIGKTHVLVEAINRRECEMRDGTVYLDGRERDVEDLLHAIFEALFECRAPLRDLRIERHLDDRQAIVALEDVDVASDRAQRLTLGVPVCRVFVTSRERVLYGVYREFVRKPVAHRHGEPHRAARGTTRPQRLPRANAPPAVAA